MGSDNLIGYFLFYSSLTRCSPKKKFLEGIKSLSGLSSTLPVIESITISG